MRRLLLLLAGLTGCASSANREALTDALAEYTHGMRWSRSEWTSPHLPRTGSLSFDPTVAPPGVQLVSCEIESVNLQADSQRALVGVRVEWMMSTEVRMRSTLLQQTWRLAEDRWEIIAQRTLEGTPFPPPRRSVGNPSPGLI
jgi:hypothetical protein